MRVYIALLFLILVACNKPASPRDYTKCTFAYDPANAKVKWTAYKFTERLGVHGTFDKVNLSGSREGMTVAAVFSGATFYAETISVNSGNAERDAKIRSAFFVTLKEGSQISGKIESFSGESATIFLRLGGVTKSVVAKVDATQLPDLKVSFPLDLNEFGAAPALEALNKVCSVLHRGKDGKSVVWPDISITISARLATNCLN